MDTLTIGEKLHDERTKRGLTLAQLRAATGGRISVNSLSAIEREATKPRFTTLRMIARALDMDLEELTEGTDLHPLADPLSGPDAQAWVRERVQEGRRLYVPEAELVQRWAEMDALGMAEEGREIEAERDEMAREIDAFVRRLREAENRRGRHAYLNALRRALKKDLGRRYTARRLDQIDAERALVASEGQKLKRADLRRIIESNKADASVR